MSFIAHLANMCADFFRIAMGDRPVASRSKGTPLFLYNTLSGTSQEFKSTIPGVVKMYNCGPTVYGPQHIGNLSMFVFVDVLRRTLEFNGYRVKQVINFTDVGHLVSDADDGEDKMTKGLKREGKALTLENMRTLGERYAQLFLADLATLNIETGGTEFPRASAYIAAQIAMVRTLEEKGYAYVGKKGVYFETTMFPAYGRLGNINLEGLREGARIEASPDKRNSTDFLLWKFSAKGRSASGGDIGWDSPWGKGFPGWHIECSAMARAILGEQIDIHTGGIEHIPVHHNNEIAQSEAATGKKPFSRFWLHRAHLQIGGSKIAKSGGNSIYLGDVAEKGFNPLAFRYLLLGSHYRTPASFTWEALAAAQNSLVRLSNLYRDFTSNAEGGSALHYMQFFEERINDDLDTPGALAVLWDMTKDATVSGAEKARAMEKFDTVFGLNIAGQSEQNAEIPAEVEELVLRREAAREAKNWSRADELRDEIASRGYAVKDTESGPRLSRNNKV